MSERGGKRWYIDSVAGPGFAGGNIPRYQVRSTDNFTQSGRCSRSNGVLRTGEA